MIQPKSTSVGEILALAKNFIVPKYQRGYAWQAEEAGEFCNDLESEAEQGRGLFLGTLIFNVARESEDKIVIVDGQQRLTTIFILLIACRERAKDLKLEGIAQETQKRITFTDPTTAMARGPLLEASETIREVFEKMANNDWDGVFPQKIGTPKTGIKQVKRQSQRIRPIYEFFSKRIADFDQPKLSKLLDSVYKTRVIRIDISDDQEAFSIFERTNARGTDLEVSDLLKNYLYQQGVASLDEKWNETIENSEGTILRMLKYFYVSTNGYVNKSDLYAKLKVYCKDVGGAAPFVEELRQFSRFYSVIRKEQGADLIKEYFASIGCKALSGDTDKFQRVHLCLQALRLFKVSQNYPVIYAAVCSIKKNDNLESKAVAKQFIRLLETMEKYHFVNNAICDRVGNEVEKLYAAYSEKFFKTKDVESTINELISSLRKQLASETEFITRFTELSYATDTLGLLAYIFDRFSNYGVAPGERVRIFNPQPGVRRNDHNIEHWLARNVDGVVVDSPTLQAIDNIGNLLAISFRANSSLGNVSPAKKIQKLNGELSKKVQNLHYVRDFLQEYGPFANEWNEKQMNERATKMAKEAYKRTWSLQ
ncbi:MAG TPA: DUF262 domain-containing protein [Candidatus Acidoferrum sp.]|nr:DUF262 domain-containing protein [Candidatus Acidoferrum sp.]